MIWTSRRASHVLLLTISHRALARDIYFQPHSPIQVALQSRHNSTTPIDITTDSQFRGLTTFANLPYVNAVLEKDANYDIAVLGAPFDTVGSPNARGADKQAVTARPGARYGPTGIRLGSRRIFPNAAWSVYTKNSSLKSWAHIVDVGDAGLTFLDNTVALKQLELTHLAVGSRSVNDTTKGSFPRIITLGGDHTTTLAALRAGAALWKEKIAVIHFDSHIDTWDPAVLGGDISEYA
jgi:agmatinase